MLQKDVTKRLSLQKILTMQVVINIAKAHLPAIVFAAEFIKHDHNSNNLMYSQSNVATPEQT